MTSDPAIRLAAFAWLEEQVWIHGDVLPRSLLAAGFEIGGNRVPLVGPQGIFKPRMMQGLPLSITAAPEGPYDDAFESTSLLSYRYRGTDPQHRDNVGLREAMRQRVPLICFCGIARGRYLAVWPVFVVGDDLGQRVFRVAADDARLYQPALGQPIVAETDTRRAYCTANVRQRLHQRQFRERVMDAYGRPCALCRLRHEELLDATHIVPDGHEKGDPVVPNGPALCTLHHAAFDGQILGVRPDYTVEVRQDVLEEQDGPMLLHGLQGLHDETILLPRAATLRPDPERLAWRYERFRRSA